MTLRFSCFLVLALCIGCQKTPAQSTTAAAAAAGGEPDKATQPQPSAAPAPVAAAAPEPAAKPVPAQLPDVLARVNGETIGKAEFEEAIRAIEGRAGRPVPPEKRDEVYRDLLDQLVGFHLLTQESKARKIAVADSEIDGQIGRIRQQFPTEEAFKQALAEQKVTLEKLRDEARTRMSVSKVVEAEVAPKVSVQPTDISSFYEQNKERFKEPESVRASHILIRAPENADEAATNKARAEADDVLKQARGGTDFAKLASEHSQDPGSATKGGELSFFTKGQMVPEFEAAAFALKAGELSGVVKTQFGFHIIKLHERRAERIVPLTEAQEQISQYLSQQQRQEKTDAFVDQLRAKAKIEILI